MDSDKTIVDGIKKHNEKSFELFVDTYGSLIKSIVKYHMKEFKQYEDECINDILMSIWNNIATRQKLYNI